MAIQRFPGDRKKFNTRQRLTSDDLQDSVDLAEYTARRILGQYVRLADSYHGFIEYGCKVTEDSPTAMTLRVGFGFGCIWDSTQLDGIDAGSYDEYMHGFHEFVVGGEANQEVTISANSSGNPRIDLIVLNLVIANAETANKDIFNTTTEAFDSTSVTNAIRKQLTVANGGIEVITGTPGATPAEPTYYNYQIPLAAVYVANGASTLANAVIFDRRVAMTPGKVVGEISITGDWNTRTFYGTTKTIKSRSGGFLNNPPDVTYVSKSTGIYNFDLSGFRCGASGSQADFVVNVKVTPKLNASYFASFTQSTSSPHLVVKIYDDSGTLVDSVFTLEVEQIEF